MQLHAIHDEEIGVSRCAVFSAIPNMDNERNFELRHVSTDDHSYYIDHCVYTAVRTHVLRNLIPFQLS